MRNAEWFWSRAVRVGELSESTFQLGSLYRANGAETSQLSSPYLDNTIHWINLYPLDSAIFIGFLNTYSLESDYAVDSTIQVFNIWDPGSLAIKGYPNYSCCFHYTQAFMYSVSTIISVANTNVIDFFLTGLITQELLCWSWVLLCLLFTMGSIVQEFLKLFTCQWSVPLVSCALLFHCGASLTLPSTEYSEQVWSGHF